MNARERARIGAILLGILVLLPATVVVADSLTHSATEGVTYVTNSGVEITLGDDQSDVDAVPFDDGETWTHRTVTVSGSDASVEVDDNTFEDDTLTVSAVDVDGELTVDRSDSDRQITFEDGDSNLFQLEDYAVENGESDFAYSSDDGLTVTLTGFDPVGVAAVDVATGEPVATDAVGSDGIATFELPAGGREIRLEETPSDLEVRDETNPDQLVDDDNVELRAQLFTDSGEVIEREVTGGTVSLDGLPKDEAIVITVKDSNADYAFRRILIDSAVQTSEIYLLPTTEPSAEVDFRVSDDTGRFPPDETRFFVEKPITRDGETEYRVISGDRVGADGSFPTILVDEERYRLRVENDAGEQRILGSYVVQGATITEVPIGDVQFSADLDEGAALDASIREAADGASHNHEIRMTYIDGDGLTEEIDITVEDTDGNELRPSTTEQISGTQPYVETYPIEDTTFDPSEDTATVTVEAERDFEIQTYEQTIGSVPDLFVDAPINDDLLEILGFGSLIAVVGLLVIVSAPMAALVGTGYAGLLTITGIIPVPLPAIALAGVVSVMATIGTHGGTFR